VISLKNSKLKGIAGLLFLISILLRVISIPHSNPDMAAYNLLWYQTLFQKGIGEALATNFSNYTPPYTYFLALATFSHGFIPPLTAIKLIPICFDLLGAFFIFKIVKLKYDQADMPYLAGAVYFTAPTVILNSAYWGQADSLYTSLLLVCLYFAMVEKSFPAILAFGLAFSIKAQAVFFLPFLAVLAIRKRIPWLYFGIIPLVYLAAVMPVVMLGRPLLDALFIYTQQADTYTVLSRNAPNFYILFPREWYSAGLIPGIAAAIGFIVYWISSTAKSKTKLDHRYIILIAFISTSLVPFLLPKMHDRYFYPADVLSIVLAFFQPSLWFIPVMYQIISTLAISNFLFGTSSSIVIIGFILNTIAIAVMIRTQRITEERGAAKQKISSALSWLAAFLIPVILFGISLNILLTPAYIRFEYAMPHIPADEYGFSKSERFQWAAQTMDYLTNGKQTRTLSRLEFENGTPVFSNYEITLVDQIKSSLRKAFSFREISLGMLFILGVFAWAGDWAAKFVNGVKRGGWLTIGSAGILGIALITLKGIQPQFDLQSTDTLLRLFPIRLWQDAFLWMMIGIFGSSSLLILFSTKVKSRIGIQK